jgi:hypothetical protein
MEDKDTSNLDTVIESLSHQENTSQVEDNKDKDKISFSSCSCGQLKLKITGSPVRSAICHCFACQQRTGSAFGYQARYLKEQVEVEGNFTLYQRIADSGNEVSFHFCPTCGSTLYWKLAAAPEYLIVAVGNLMDPSFLPPVFSVYGCRRHSWVEIPSNIEKYD